MSDLGLHRFNFLYGPIGTLKHDTFCSHRIINNRDNQFVLKNKQFRDFYKVTD